GRCRYGDLSRIVCEKRQATINHSNEYYELSRCSIHRVRYFRINNLCACDGIRKCCFSRRFNDVLARATDYRFGEPRSDSCSSTAFKRSEEHTSELQSRFDLVCRLL